MKNANFDKPVVSGHLGSVLGSVMFVSKTEKPITLTIENGKVSADDANMELLKEMITKTPAVNDQIKGQLLECFTEEKK